MEERDGTAMEGAGPRTEGTRRGAGLGLRVEGASREKLGTTCEGGLEAEAFGVVCSSCSAMVGGGGTTRGRGGGGMDTLSSWRDCGGPVCAPGLLLSDEVAVVRFLSWPAGSGLWRRSGSTS